MKEFDLELAKAGHPVQTRDGRKARIICWDRKDDGYPIVALVAENNGNEMCFSFAINGHIKGGYCPTYSLVMAPEKHEGWINIYRTCGEIGRTSNIIYTSKERAEMGANGRDLITTVKIEWEE